MRVVRSVLILLVFTTLVIPVRAGADLDESQQVVLEQNINAIGIWNNRPNQARADLSSTLILASKHGQEFGIRLTQLNLGRLEVRLGNWKIAQEKLLEATDYFIASDYNNWRLISFVAKAEYFLAKEDYDRALDALMDLAQDRSFRKGLKVDKQRQRLFADCLLRTGQYEAAMEQFNHVLAQYKEEGNYAGVGKTHQAIGLAWFRAGEYEKAKLRYKRARGQFEKAGETYELARNRLLVGLCDIQLGNLEQAINNIRAAVDLAQHFNATQLELEARLALARAYKSAGKLEEALQQNELAHSIQDSLFNEESIKIAQDLDAKSEVKQTLLRDSELNDKYQKKQLQTTLLTWSLIVTGFLGLLTILAYRGKRRSVSQLAEAKEKVELQQKKILDSINYAKNIQKSIVTPVAAIKASPLKDFFIFFEPRDKVSGDIYFFHQDGDQVIMAAIDCTGHGIPGAFMALIGHTLLNNIVVEHKQYEPSEILKKLNLEVISTLRQTSSELHSQAGMDMSLCTINTKTRSVAYAGARNHLYKVVRGKLEVIKATPMSVGGKPLHKQRTVQREYNQTEFTLEGDDTWIYLFSDGFMDQYGGQDRKKYNSRNFKGLLTTCANFEGEAQHGRLKASFSEWKGEVEQIDDVLVIGLLV